MDRKFALSKMSSVFVKVFAFCAIVFMVQAGMTAEDFVKEVKALAIKSHDPGRAALVKKVLDSASGIYKDKSKVKSPRLEKTILLNVLESGGHKWNPGIDTMYKQQTYNHLCYTKSLGLETVVYIIKENEAKYEADIKEMKNVDENIKVTSTCHINQ